MALDVGPAEDMAGHLGLRVEPLGLAGEDDRRLAERVHRGDQLGHGAAREIDEIGVAAQHRAILGGVALGHQHREPLGDLGAGRR